MDNKKIIGQRINSALAKRNVKQKELAAALNVSDNTISYFVSGKRTPNTGQIIKISQTLKVSTDYLLGLADNMISENIAVGAMMGLSDKAIFNIKRMKGSCLSDTLDNILSHDTFFRAVVYIYDGAKMKFLKKHYRMLELDNICNKNNNGKIPSTPYEFTNETIANLFVQKSIYHFSEVANDIIHNQKEGES